MVAGCTKQFRGTLTTPTTALHQWTTEFGTTRQTAYNPELSRVFHQWVSLCDNGGFTPTRAGDYYLQVRTNVTFGGTQLPNVNPSGTTLTSVVSKDNPAADDPTGNAPTGAAGGVGNNSFAIRAVPAVDAMRSQVAVAGYYRMPIFQNQDGGTGTFNLIRALPPTKGQYIAFDFFDVADCSGTCQGTVQVIKPGGCDGVVHERAQLPALPCGTEQRGVHKRRQLSGDRAELDAQRAAAAHDRAHSTGLHLQPDDPGWLLVLGEGRRSPRAGRCTDITTWTANIGGDPVRLIE